MKIAMRFITVLSVERRKLRKMETLAMSALNPIVVATVSVTIR